jgi:predicted DNA-binding transcriptional regulator YafY
MRRADRLFQIIQMLRHRRLTTAAQLAERLEVSERTIYRDMSDLSRSGVPVEGEAGVGYRLGKDFDLPPLMFDANEIQALVLGARMVEGWADDELRKAAASALEKVEAALPEPRRARLRETALFALAFRVPEDAREHLGLVRRAVELRRVVEVDYVDPTGRATTRRVRPLGLYFWGSTWTLGAWCELRENFRNFRVDRIARAELLDEVFELRNPVTLEAYVEAMQAQHPEI